MERGKIKASRLKEICQWPDPILVQLTAPGECGWQGTVGPIWGVPAHFLPQKTWGSQTTHPNPSPQHLLKPRNKLTVSLMKAEFLCLLPLGGGEYAFKTELKTPFTKSGLSAWPGPRCSIAHSLEPKVSVKNEHTTREKVAY